MALLCGNDCSYWFWGKNRLDLAVAFLHSFLYVNILIGFKAGILFTCISDILIFFCFSFQKCDLMIADREKTNYFKLFRGNFFYFYFCILLIKTRFINATKSRTRKMHYITILFRSVSNRFVSFLFSVIISRHKLNKSQLKPTTTAIVF